MPGTLPVPTVTTNLAASINSVLAGSFTKSGSSTLTLGSAANSAYAGTITVSQGAVSLTSALNGNANVVLGDVNTGASNPSIVYNTAGTAFNIGTLTVSSGVTGATISFPQNTSTVSYNVNGVTTLNSPLIMAESNASSSHWSQLTTVGKVTGNGGGSGNDTLIINNTAPDQIYWTTGTGVVNDFSGNVRLQAGLVAIQAGSPGTNQVIPDSSALIIQGGEWRWNSNGFVETIDGLGGAGLWATRPM